jgi:hypothetical protein
VLIEPGDPSAIYSEVMKLFKDDEHRAQTAQRGMISVRERFTAQRMVERHLELYRKWTGTA